MQTNKTILLEDHSSTPVEAIQFKNTYCISNELRQQQINQAFARGFPSLVPQPSTMEPIAIVGFGPSLVSQLDEIRKFKYILSMSGATQLLLDNGIVSTWHMECDPRPHKADFLKTPHDDTEYLLLSCVHQAVFEKLKGKKIKLWHMPGIDTMDQLPLLFPRETWLVLIGGSNVGTCSMPLARMLGFHDFHVFGLDHSFESEVGATHAGFHPNSTKHRMKVRANGKEYITSTVFLQGAKDFFDVMVKLGDCRATIYGDSLLKAMAAEKPAPDIVTEQGFLLAAQIKPVATPEYTAQNFEMHKKYPTYGMSGIKRADTVIKLMASDKFKTVLDYGCGKGTLADALPFPIWEYDIAIENKNRAPRPADLVICSDMLEHVEPEMLDNVIGDLRRVTNKLLYVVVHTGPAMKILPDGRNAHLIQQSGEWWKEKLSKLFEVGPPVKTMNGLEVHLCCAPKNEVQAILRTHVPRVPAKVEKKEVKPVLPPMFGMQPPAEKPLALAIRALAREAA